VFHARALPDRRDDFFPAFRFRLPPAVVPGTGFDVSRDDFLFALFFFCFLVFAFALRFFALLESIRGRGRRLTTSGSWSREVTPGSLGFSVAGDRARRPRNSWVAFDKTPAAWPNLRAIRLKTGSASDLRLAFSVAISFPPKPCNRGKRSPGRQAGTFQTLLGTRKLGRATLTVGVLVILFGFILLLVIFLVQVLAALAGLTTLLALSLLIADRSSLLIFLVHIVCHENFLLKESVRLLTPLGLSPFTS
jgi:hypothetical protein